MELILRDHGRDTHLAPIDLRDLDPALVPALVQAVAKATRLVAANAPASPAQLLERADAIAAVAVQLQEPDLELLDERRRRMATVKRVLDEGEWLTAEQINALQQVPPANRSLPASDWKRRGRVFSVNAFGKDLYARYQFDALYQPLPVIREVLEAFGPVADAWTLAAWFHFPNAWLVRDGMALAPKDCLDRGADVVRAAARRLDAYVA